MWPYSNFPNVKELNAIFFYRSMKRDKGSLLGKKITYFIALLKYKPFFKQEL